MALSAGTRLGPYEIVSLLGAGGMGEVYRARDTKLNRDVAIKILPDAFASDRDRVGRFEREAQALAALNHPHIAQIYGLEQSATTSALVMELVEGEDLAQRIARGTIPIDEALAIARQIADGLEAAHEKGIVHRDLKPANIKLTPDGTVKILDFGLAKAAVPDLQQDPAHSPTFTVAATRMGMIVGTAAYMAPEQARGKAVDKRADIWAFGCVLYEMLAGTQTFAGDTVTDILAAIVQREPDWTKLPASTPDTVRRLLQRCLQKDPKLRLRDIGDARLDVIGALEPGLVSPASGPWWNGRKQAVAGAAAVAAIAAAFAAGLRLGSESERVVTRTSILPPDGHRVTSGPVITRDGRRIAFASTDGTHPPRLYLRSLDTSDLRVVPDSDGAEYPFFSPDGRWIAYFAQRQLFKADLQGGAPVSLAATSSPNGGTWSDDGTIVFTPTWNGGLYRVNASGGPAEPLIQPDRAKQEYAYTWPYFLPGGKELLFSVWGATFSISRLSLGSGERRVVAPGAWPNAVATSTGFVLVGNGGYSTSESGEVQAWHLDGSVAPVAVLERVHWSGGPGDGLFKFAVSDAGTLVYAPGDIRRRSLVLVDHTGRDTLLDADPQPYGYIALSPDGRKLALAYTSGIWIEDLERGTRTPVFAEHRSGGGSSPVWSADGARLFFAANQSGDWEIYARSAAATDSPQLILQKTFDQFPNSVAPDGTLAFEEVHPDSGSDLWMLPAGGMPVKWLATPAVERSARFSPDGRLVAYTSNVSGRFEVYVQPTQGTDRMQVSTNGGTQPAWSPRGDRLFYREGNTMMAVDIQPGPPPNAGKPRRLFDGGWHLPGLVAAGDPSDIPFAVLPDGERFVMVRFDREALPTGIEIVVNWFEELRQKLGGR